REEVLDGDLVKTADDYQTGVDAKGQETVTGHAGRVIDPRSCATLAANHWPQKRRPNDQSHQATTGVPGECPTHPETYDNQDQGDCQANHWLQNEGDIGQMQAIKSQQ